MYVIVTAADVSMPFLGRVTPYLGALPLPDGLAATHNFTQAISRRVEQKRVICIYPEAHIWPYCTKIRNFRDASFRYPVQYKTPSYCFTNVYTKRKFFATPKITTYVDGPFYPDETLSPAEARRKLRDEIYDAMCERSKLSDYDGIIYVKEKEND